MENLFFFLIFLVFLIIIINWGDKSIINVYFLSILLIYYHLIVANDLRARDKEENHKKFYDVSLDGKIVGKINLSDYIDIKIISEQKSLLWVFPSLSFAYIHLVAFDYLSKLYQFLIDISFFNYNIDGFNIAHLILYFLPLLMLIIGIIISFIKYRFEVKELIKYNLGISSAGNISINRKISLFNNDY